MMAQKCYVKSSSSILFYFPLFFILSFYFTSFLNCSILFHFYFIFIFLFILIFLVYFDFLDLFQLIFIFLIYFDFLDYLNFLNLWFNFIFLIYLMNFLSRLSVWHINPSLAQSLFPVINSYFYRFFYFLFHEFPFLVKQWAQIYWHSVQHSQ